MLLELQNVNLTETQEGSYKKEKLMSFNVKDEY